jgi:hypothetical protein
MIVMVKRMSYPDDVDPEDVGSVMQALADGAFGGPVLSFERHTRVGHVTDLASLLVAIEQTLPRPAVMFIEGTRIAPEVETLLESRSVRGTRDDLWGTSWPVPDGFHLPVSDENLRDLRDLVERHAAPEEPYPFSAICDHVVVYSGDVVLMGAYDVGSEVWLSSDLPAETIELFRVAAGAT